MKGLIAMCVFCKIVNSEIPCFKIYETDNTLAFLDISQITKGHTLVIPKKHYRDLLSLDPDIAKEISEAVLEVTHILKTKLGVDNFNLLNNSGPLAGQEVPHFHMHILPRYENDGISFSKPHQPADMAVIKKLHENITK